MKMIRNFIHLLSTLFVYFSCFVFEIHKKNYYHACKNCKKSTEKLNCNVFYCSQCHKNVETFNCHTFSVILSDFTSSISVDVIGEHA